MYVILIIVMAGMWFFMSRNQKKEQQKRQDLLGNMKPGDGIVTIGGLHGILAEVNDSKGTVTLDCEGIFLEFERTAVRTVKPAEGTAVTEAPVIETPEPETTTADPAAEDVVSVEEENKE